MAAADGLVRVTSQIGSMRLRWRTGTTLAGFCVLLAAILPGHQPLWWLLVYSATNPDEFTSGDSGQSIENLADKQTQILQAIGSCVYNHNANARSQHVLLELDVPIDCQQDFEPFRHHEFEQFAVPLR